VSGIDSPSTLGRQGIYKRSRIGAGQEVIVERARIFIAVRNTGKRWEWRSNYLNSKGKNPGVTCQSSKNLWSLRRVFIEAINESLATWPKAKTLEIYAMGDCGTNHWNYKVVTLEDGQRLVEADNQKMPQRMLLKEAIVKKARIYGLDAHELRRLADVLEALRKENLDLSSPMMNGDFTHVEVATYDNLNITVRISGGHCDDCSKSVTSGTALIPRRVINIDRIDVSEALKQIEYLDDWVTEDESYGEDYTSEEADAMQEPTQLTLF
jgi:hypothetical protein